MERKAWYKKTRQWRHHHCDWTTHDEPTPPFYIPNLSWRTRLMYAPIIPIKEEITVTRFTMSEDLILKKNDVVAAVFCDSDLATEVINYLNRK